MSELRTAHTSDVDAATLAAARALLYDVFADDFEEDDWEHALGGIHALIWEADELVGHASVVQRRLLYGGRALRCGYVEGVAVRADQRRRGYGGALMEAVERVIRGAYDLGALGTSEEALPLYTARGWRPWEGETYALTPAGRVRTPEDDDALYVLELGAVPLDRAGEIACDWRDGAVW